MAYLQSTEISLIHGMIILEAGARKVCRMFQEQVCMPLQSLYAADFRFPLSQMAQTSLHDTLLPSSIQWITQIMQLNNADAG